MRLADFPSIDVDLTPNAYECTEGGETFDLGAGEEFDEDAALFPYDAGHYVQPLLICTDVPDGVNPDAAAQCWNYGTRRYEFRLEP